MTQPEQEPEFIKHEVESAEDWSEWVCPNPHKYLMKCYDCGSVHEAQFSVVRYKSEEEREACNFVDDPNLQAVFRMRRSKQWSPEDTAHNAICALLRQANDALALTSYPPQRTWVGLTDEEIEKGRDQTFSINNPYCPCDSKTMRKAVRWAEAKLKDKNTGGKRMNERIKDKVSYSIPIVCIAAILVLTFMMVISK